MYSDRTGTDKSHPGQNLPDKRPPDKTSGQNLYKGAFVRVFYTRPSKIGGGPRCVTYFRGWVPGCVTKCDRGKGVKIGQNSVTYFMDGPVNEDLFDTTISKTRSVLFIMSEVDV